MEEGVWRWPWRIVDLGNHLRSQISLEETQAEPVTLCKCQVSEQEWTSPGPPSLDSPPFPTE